MDSSSHPDALGMRSLDLLARNWWLLAFRGACGVAFGLTAMLAPGLGFRSLSLLFAGYLLADGGLAIAAAACARHRRRQWGALAAEGLIDLAAAGAIAMVPGLTIAVMVYITAFWAVLSGVALLLACGRLAKGDWLVALAAAASILLGGLLVFAPLNAAIAMAVWLGIYAIVFGTALLGFSVNLRRAANIAP
jgi:uncharacterized membrane protein HdeD (DUF308 family)